MRSSDERWMRLALRLARRGYGRTSPNPMVGAVLVRGDRELGSGWHRGAGRPHAEVEALKDARQRGERARGATLFVTLEPCSTQGRTPPCTKAILDAGIKRVVVGSCDPNPAHNGRGLTQLRRKGVPVQSGVLDRECARLNEAFHHWVVSGQPWVTLKAAMTLDGKIADAGGRSKWITGELARRQAMRLRAGADAVLVGINTVLSDDPALTVRGRPKLKPLRRLILDSRARTPLDAQVVTDADREATTIVVTRKAPQEDVDRLRGLVDVWVAPGGGRRVNLKWLMRKLGSEDVTSLLVEGGGEVHASFLEQGLARRVAFFYAPKILGDAQGRRGIAGRGVRGWEDMFRLSDLSWRRFGPDLFLTALVV